MRKFLYTGFLCVLISGSLPPGPALAQLTRPPRSSSPNKSRTSVPAKRGLGGTVPGKYQPRGAARSLSGSRTSPSRAKLSQPRPRAGATPAKESPPAEGKVGAAKTSQPEEDVDSLGKFRSFIRANSLWILTALGAGVAGSVTWLFLAGRRRKGGESFLDSLDSELEAEPASKGDRKYSSTKISRSDVESRLGGPVGGTEVETDREYALVVEEEALKTAKVDERTGRQLAPDDVIRNLARDRDYAGAYEEYRRQIEGDGSLEFRADIERALSEHFLRQRDYRKAARILEHHVATHPTEDIQPRVYFNLGYIHVLTKTYNKSRRFFKLYIGSESDARLVDRAKDILKHLDAKLGSAQD